MTDCQAQQRDRYAEAHAPIHICRTPCAKN
jgi:hypothetical protein